MAYAFGFNIQSVFAVKLALGVLRGALFLIACVTNLPKFGTIVTKKQGKRHYPAKFWDDGDTGNRIFVIRKKMTTFVDNAERVRD